MVVDWTHGTNFSKNCPFPNPTQNPLQKQIVLSLMYTAYYCYLLFTYQLLAWAKFAIYSLIKTNICGDDHATFLFTSKCIIVGTL